jgi:hypothetical protein
MSARDGRMAGCPRRAHAASVTPTDVGDTDEPRGKEAS